jgi:uncharacterized protein (TIGR02246 family)
MRPWHLLSLFCALPDGEGFTFADPKRNPPVTLHGGSMRLVSTGKLRAASAAAIPLVAAALLSAGCTDPSDATAPVRAQPVGLPARPPSVSISIDPIMDLVTAATAAWSAKDASAYAAGYADDMQLVGPLGALLTGRDAFRAQHVFLFNGPFAGSTQTIQVRDVRFLTGTIAIVAQDVSLTGYAFLPPGLPSSGGVVRTRVTWVVEKRQGRWEIVFQQMTPLL